MGEWTIAGTRFQGTPIAPHHFITAKHVGGGVGDILVLNGSSYTALAIIDDPSSDLRIVRVNGTFSTWAPLYRGTNEVGKPLMVFGRGLTRGSEITVNGELKGWTWGMADGRLRWGENAVASITVFPAGLGEMLYATFDNGAGPNEAHLAVGDSSGPLFIQDGSTWVLAGVAYAIDAYFSYGNSGPGFNAALFDARGLYYGPYASPPTWRLLSSFWPISSGFYATRVSNRAAWIDSVLPPPSPPPVPAPVLDHVHFWILGLLLGGLGVRATILPQGSDRSI